MNHARKKREWSTEEVMDQAEKFVKFMAENGVISSTYTTYVDGGKLTVTSREHHHPNHREEDGIHVKITTTISRNDFITVK